MSLDRRTLIAAGLAALAPAAASAHHSTAMFDWGVETTLEGEVQEFQWTNPHSFIWLKVGGDVYALEGMSPNALGRSGWTKRTITPGQQVKAIAYMLKDGRKGGFCARVVLPDGTVMRQVGPRVS